ncbi:MAG: peptidyl-prolyl cis-trans isomerase [Deltaproteobacteria bacterium]|nr:peptidyl-prolyl cis-trans isomerase [Deltaproteobacteria bacterium]
MVYGNTVAVAAQNPQVIFSTTKGKLTIELYANKAPISVKNFLAYVDSGFYDGVIFHRVIPGFVIQGGGFTAEMAKKDTKAPIKNEADNGLKNLRGTLSLARTQVVDSATTQFFINLQDNAALDHRADNFGYAVFGKVVEGMDVVDTIAGVPTSNHGHYRNVPTIPVIIKKATRKKP